MLPSEVYNQLEPDRAPYVKRAEEISSLTLPYLMNTDSFSGSNPTRHEIAQSFNGMLVNNLKAKIGMALLPPSTSSFRFKPDARAMMDLLGKDNTARAKLDEELSFNTDIINAEIENQQIRSELFDMIAHLIVVGSVVVEKLPEDGLQVIPLNNFVVDLDNKGRPYTIVVKETVKELPDNITVSTEKEEYDLYTMAKYDIENRNWLVTQDIDGEEVGDDKTYKDYDDLPFRYLGWTWNIGDKYHRPFSEDYIDDMKQVNILSRLNTSGAVVSGKVNLFVDPRGNRTRKQDVANSQNGDVLDGRADDVTAFQLNKHFDFQVTNERQQEIMKTLKQCFLDTGSVTRNAERVTAQEIRIMAQQLEASTLAGIYSKMSLQFSKWIVGKIMKELGIKFEAIEVSILTGLDALGRNQEVQKLDSFIQRMSQLDKMEYINESELISRYAAFEGIATVGLIKTPEEVQQARQAAQQQAQQAAMQQAGAESMGKEGGAAAVQQMMPRQ